MKRKTRYVFFGFVSLILIFLLFLPSIALSEDLNPLEMRGARSAAKDALKEQGLKMGHFLKTRASSGSWNTPKKINQSST